MKAKKSNRSYNIEPREVNSFKSQGYDIYNDEGKLIAFGAGKTVSAEKYFEVLKENEKLKEQITLMVEKMEKKAKKESK